MDEQDSLLLELMLQAEVFCSQVEAAAKKTLSIPEMCELSLKISQCRGALYHLQDKYESDQLTITDSTVCADFRQLMMAILWVNFLGSAVIDARLYRKLVQIESGFTYLLISRREQSSTGGT
ncbi:MAG TPA: hypothetical protein VGF73_11435 [Chthoniobacterales bacterium]|jgi:hypothetical protein